jgi:hypothetical protein
VHFPVGVMLRAMAHSTTYVVTVKDTKQVTLCHRLCARTAQASAADTGSHLAKNGLAGSSETAE